MNLFEAIGFIGLAASAVYLVVTKNYGTPLKDSYTEAQHKIKLESAGRRRRAYYIGVGVGIAAYLLWKSRTRR